MIELILEVAGGSLCEGTCEDGAPLPEAHRVMMRTDRCRQLMGVEIDDETMIGYLDRLGFQPSIQDGLVSTTVPVHRGDIEREVDLIEEVVRMHGFDAIDLPDDMRLRPASMPPAVDCWRAVSNVLVGCDFVESITHTLIGDREATAFLEDGQTAMRVGKACAGGDPCLRPSVLASLLRVRKFNTDQGIRTLSLFERGSTFHDHGAGRVEKRQIGLLTDSGPDDLRPLRGVIERLANLICGPGTRVDIDPVKGAFVVRPGGEVRFNDTVVDGRDAFARHDRHLRSGCGHAGRGTLPRSTDGELAAGLHCQCPAGLPLHRTGSVRDCRRGDQLAKHSRSDFQAGIAGHGGNRVHHRISRQGHRSRSQVADTQASIPRGGQTLRNENGRHVPGVVECLKQTFKAEIRA